MTYPYAYEKDDQGSVQKFSFITILCVVSTFFVLLLYVQIRS